MQDSGVNQALLERIRTAMLDALRTLPFSTDMFVIDTASDKVAHHTVVAYILVSVVLNATEVDVCRAVAKWADIVNAERAAREGDGAEASESAVTASQALEPLPGVELVKSKLDLSFVSSHDIYNVRLPSPRGLRLLALCMQHAAIYC